MNNLFNNSDLFKILDLIKKENKTPKELFYEKAKEMGVDPEDILNQIR